MKKYQHFDPVYVRFFNPPTIMLRPNRIMYQPSGIGAWAEEFVRERGVFQFYLNFESMGCNISRCFIQNNQFLIQKKFCLFHVRFFTHQGAANGRKRTNLDFYRS